MYIFSSTASTFLIQFFHNINEVLHAFDLNINIFSALSPFLRVANFSSSEKCRCALRQLRSFLIGIIGVSPIALITTKVLHSVRGPLVTESYIIIMVNFIWPCFNSGEGPILSYGIQLNVDSKYYQVSIGVGWLIHSKNKQVK